MRPFLLAGIMPGVLLAGCTAEAARGLPEISAYPSPDDPSAIAGTARYHPVVGAYTHRVAKGPRGWRATGVEMAPLAQSSPEITSEPAPEPAIVPTDEVLK